jgi:hypothetical protein
MQKLRSGSDKQKADADAPEEGVDAPGGDASSGADAVEEAGDEGGVEEAPAERAPPPPGQYQLLVHVVEGKDLAAKSRSGTSDPVAKATLSLPGRPPVSRSTSIKKQDCSPFWDEMLEFELALADPFELAAAHLDLQVYSAHDKVGKRKLIGGQTLALATAWAEPAALHRRWLGLSTLAAPGLQGYARVSVLLFPLGEAPSWGGGEGGDDDDDDDDDDGVTNVLLPESVEMETGFLRLHCYQAVDLPEMDEEWRVSLGLRHYMIQPLVELYGGCMVVLKVSRCDIKGQPGAPQALQEAQQGRGRAGRALRRLHQRALRPGPAGEDAGRAQVAGPGVERDARPPSASLYASTFSRTVWRLYGGAKGLAMWY